MHKQRVSIGGETTVSPVFQAAPPRRWYRHYTRRQCYVRCRCHSARHENARGATPACRHSRHAYGQQQTRPHTRRFYVFLLPPSPPAATAARHAAFPRAMFGTPSRRNCAIGGVEMARRYGGVDMVMAIQAICAQRKERDSVEEVARVADNRGTGELIEGDGDR